MCLPIYLFITKLKTDYVATMLHIFKNNFCFAVNGKVLLAWKYMLKFQVNQSCLVQRVLNLMQW